MDSNYDVRTVVPVVPTWAVFYDEDRDDVYSLPVLWYESRLNEYSHGPSYDFFNPVVFSPDALMEPEDRDSANFLGLSLTKDSSIFDWQKEIASYKNKTKK